MKVEAFYLNDISNYEDIIDYLTNTIDNKYYGVGKNSISISRLITFLKKAIKIYVRLKYQKDINIIMTLPTIDEKLVINDTINNNLVKIRLNYDKISSILEGKFSDYQTYLEELLEQLETEITSNNKFSFTEYLTVQLTGLIDVAVLELKSNYSSSYLKHNLVNKASWIKLSQHSSVFRDYYNAYMDSPNNKKLFYTFLKGVVSKI